ncbi:MAG: DUF885 family protein [Gammaproteobacteria bacterium]|nr:DUF885 family protein [Gammaproteobacteria bacterium]
MDYQELISLYADFQQWLDTARLGKERSLTDVAGKPVVAHPDYSTQAIKTRRAEIHDFHARLDTLAVHQWSVAQQAEFLAVRARIDQEHFRVNVTRPWARDPGFYVDRILRLTFAELPLAGEALSKLQAQLAAVPALMSEAPKNLTDVAADYADLALFNLSTADGVGHGFPYRATPPAGVIGWYEDLLVRASKQQPVLRDAIIEAKTAIENFNTWLRDHRSVMTGKAGVGRDNFNWYLKHVKLLPYTTDQIVVLGERELDRLWSVYALERHRNRNLPEIALPSSAEEYQRRIEQTDRHIRRFLVDEEIITIPEYIGDLETNVPWIVRDKGPNFWEQIQYRNPTPDHLHAVIPGHRFDAVVERQNPHPIRGQLTDGVRTEGWGVYLEEAMIHAGLLDDLEIGPRVRELIYLFGIFRAARMPVDVWLQQNEMTVSQAVDYWVERVPYLDPDVARVDAEIYLRRPPGYGLGYMTGMIQMQALLAERKRQLKDDFNLRNFHDTLMNAGRLPLALLRWEMTGLDNEIAGLWSREPLPSRHRTSNADIAWIASGGFCEPETVLPLPDLTFLVSNVCGFRETGNGFLTLLDTQGKTLDWRIVDELDSPVGMTLVGERLYVVDNNTVKVMRWPSYTLLETIALNTQVANDVAVASDGSIYVTDSAGHSVVRRLPDGTQYRVAGDYHFKNANGIQWHDDGLYVGGARLWRVDPDAESVEMVGPELLADIDGIEFESDGTLQITPVGGPLIRYRNDDDIEVISGKGVSSANHGYASVLQLALIPTGYDNTVIAIKVP